MEDKLFNRVVHFEIHAAEPERAAKFYTDVFGWTIKKWDSDEMEYWLVMTGPENAPGGINGGIMRRKGDAPKTSDAVNGYVCSILVEDIDSTIKKLKTAGGVVSIPKYDLAGVGMMAYFKDTEGNTFGIWQETKKK